MKQIVLFQYLDGNFKELIESILRNYTGVDGGHGRYHIETVIENSIYGLNKEELQDGLTNEQVILTAAMHDIGLVPEVNKVVLNSIATPNLLRKDHHVRGAEILKRLVLDSDKCKELHIKHKYLTKVVSIGKFDMLCHSIAHHRASVDQTTWLDKFIRCCDGLDNHKVKLARAWLYNKTHYQMSNEQIITQIKTHLTEKYLGDNAYCSKLPQEWAMLQFNNEKILLADFLQKLNPDKQSVEKLLDYIGFTLSEMIYRNNQVNDKTSVLQNIK